jgi:hypothetical protein
VARTTRAATTNEHDHLPGRKINGHKRGAFRRQTPQAQPERVPAKCSAAFWLHAGKQRWENVGRTFNKQRRFRKRPPRKRLPQPSCGGRFVFVHGRVWVGPEVVRYLPNKPHGRYFA